jgi:transposase
LKPPGVGGEQGPVRLRTRSRSNWRAFEGSVRRSRPSLATEVFYRTFANRRAVASFVGLTPTPYSSGTSSREQGISKAGNAWARHHAVELAWLWLRNQPTSGLTRWFHVRVGDAKGRVRRIAIVAMARKLIVALWRFLETGLVPDGAIVKG